MFRCEGSRLHPDIDPDQTPLGADKDAELARLRKDNEALQTQVQRLIQTERSLYRSRSAHADEISRLDALNQFMVTCNPLRDELAILRHAQSLFEAAYTMDQMAVFERRGRAGWFEIDLRGKDGSSGRSEACRPTERRVDPRSCALLDAALARGPTSVAIDPTTAESPIQDRLVACGRVADPVRAHPSRPEPLTVLLIPPTPAPGGRTFVLLVGTDGARITFHHRLPGLDDTAGIRLATHTIEATLRRAVDLRRIETTLADLREACARLVEANAVKTRFINAAAHELNTPLTPIRMQLFLLRKHLAEESEAAPTRSLAILERNMARLEKLVEAILDGARIEAGTLRRDPRAMPLADLVSQCVESFEALAASKRVRLELANEPGLVVEVDPHRLEQAMYNLLRNAFKFVGDRGTVKVRTCREGDLARIDVEDDGIGMTEDQVSRLFEPFTQVHDVAPHGDRGSGLGLYITRGIIEQHQGSIECASPGPGKGTTFTILLPLSEAQLQEARPKETPRAQA